MAIRRRRAAKVCFTLVCLGIAGLQARPAGEAMAAETRRVKSFQDLKYATVVRQVFDFSCGSAALATVLTHFMGRPTGEPDVIRILRQRYNTEEKWKKRQEEGFSFEDLIFAAKALGDGAALPRVVPSVVCKSMELVYPATKSRRGFAGSKLTELISSVELPPKYDIYSSPPAPATAVFKTATMPSAKTDDGLFFTALLVTGNKPDIE